MFKISTSELNKHKKISAVFDGGYKEYVSMIYKNLRKLVRFSSVFFFLQKPNLLRTRTAEQK